VQRLSPKAYWHWRRSGDRDVGPLRPAPHGVTAAGMLQPGSWSWGTPPGGLRPRMAGSCRGEGRGGGVSAFLFLQTSTSKPLPAGTGVWGGGWHGAGGDASVQTVLQELASAWEEDHKPQPSHVAARRLIQHKEPLDVYFPLGVPGGCKQDFEHRPEAPTREPADVGCAGSVVAALRGVRVAGAVSRERWEQFPAGWRAAGTRADPPGERQPGLVFQPLGGNCRANLAPSPGNTVSRLLTASSLLRSWSTRSRQEQHKNC